MAWEGLEEVFQSFSADSLLNFLDCSGTVRISLPAQHFLEPHLLTNEEVESNRENDRHWGGAVMKSWAGMAGGRLTFLPTKSLLSSGINTEVPEEQPPQSVCSKVRSLCCFWA